MNTISITKDRFWELEEAEKEYKALKALLFFFGDKNPGDAIYLMKQAVRYADQRKKEQGQKGEE